MVGWMLVGVCLGAAVWWVVEVCLGGLVEMGGEVRGGRVLGYEEVDDQESNGGRGGRGDEARRIGYPRFTDEDGEGGESTDRGLDDGEREGLGSRDGHSREEA